MKRWIIAVAAAASVAFPAASQAQPAGGPGGPPPAARARFEKMLGDARIAALAAVGPDHRADVQAITTAVAARSLDPRTGAQKIDALLTPDERTRVNAVDQKLRSDMRAAMAGMPPPPGGAGPGGGPPMGAGPGFAGRAPDPGRFLLMLSRTRRFQGPEPRASGAP